MTLGDVVLDIRLEIMRIFKTKDNKQAEDLYITLDRLLESAYDRDAKEQAVVLTDLLDSARDAIGGMYWKAEIPSEETILKAFPSATQEAS